MIDPKDITIIIPHFGAEKEQCYSLRQCLDSLIESSPEIEVVIAKNGPACYCPRNLRVCSQGQCKAVNAAVAITKTPWVMISNDDMVYAPGWFESLQNYQIGTSIVNLDDGHIFCISPQLIEPRPGAPTFETFFAGGAGGDFNKEKWNEFAREQMGKHPLLRTGFNLPFLIKRELWDLIGGYDIDYDPWGSNSDSDLEYKIRLAGIQPFQNTNSIVYHFSQTSGTFHPKNGEYYGRNFVVFENKWGFKRTDDGIWQADFKIPTKEEGRKFNPWWENFYNK